MIEDTSLLGYTNLTQAFERLQSCIDITPAMIVVKSLALSFILLNLIKKWFESKGDIGKAVTPMDVISAFSYMLLILFYTDLLQYIERLGGAFEEWLQSVFSQLNLDMTVRSYYESTPSKMGNIGFGGAVLADIVIALLDGLSWLINTMAFAGFLLERGFLLLLLNLMFPFVFCMAALNTFRDMVSTWIRVYFSIYFISAVLIGVNVIIDALYSALMEHEIIDNATQIIDTSDWSRVVFVFTLVFAKVMLYRSGINVLAKLFRV